MWNWAASRDREERQPTARRVSRVVIHLYRAGLGALCQAGRRRWGSRVLRSNANPDRVTCLRCRRIIQEEA